jgi:hypothetical protein
MYDRLAPNVMGHPSEASPDCQSTGAAFFQGFWNPEALQPAREVSTGEQARICRDQWYSVVPFRSYRLSLSRIR